MDARNLSGIGMTSARARSRLVERLRGKGIGDERVLESIGSTPRHFFVDEALEHRAYEETSLPIGFNQTISQPYIVAKMVELLEPGNPSEKVLEIGTGSGYQTAILSQLYDYVYTVERIRELQRRARQKLRKLRIRNVSFRHFDGTDGWPERGPFDAIVCSAAAGQIPDTLLPQLREGGVLAIPVVGDGEQQLYRVRKVDGKSESVRIESVHFVPLLPGRIN